MCEPVSRVLVVDDDAMNRKLTTMFLKKLGYESRMAESGRDALEAVKQERFAMILMDYRMPEMDGVEVTGFIRHMEGTYFKEVPVIALTGDERENVRLKFAEAGITDVLQKPLNAESLSAVLERWLGKKDDNREPEASEESGEPRAESTQQNISVEEYDFLQKTGIYAEAGIRNCGSGELWLGFLKDFHNLVDFKVEKLANYLSEGQFKEYTIEVHALKNSARLIGALELSRDFADLEEWGNQGEFEKIVARNPQVLRKMIECKAVLRPFAGEDREVQAVSGTQIKEVLWAMKAAVEAFDIDGVDFCMQELERYEVPGCESRIEKLKAYVADVALEDILEEISEIIYIIEKAE